MRLKTTFVASVAILLTVAVPVGAETKKGPSLRIHIPRKAMIAGNEISVADICVVRSADAKLLAKADAIAMGRAPLPGETLVIDRHTIVCRLAANGIPAARVSFTGARQIALGRVVQTVSRERILTGASAVVAKNPPTVEGGKWRLTTQPKAMTVPLSKDLTVRAKLLKSSNERQLHVEVSATVGGRQAGTRRLIYKLICRRKVAVATCNIPAAAPITFGNCQVRTIPSDMPTPAGWTPPYGMLASRPLAKDTIIDRSMTRPVQMAIVVKRGRNVVMTLSANGFKIIALGTALENGKPGEWIRVQNVDSKRIISAHVNFDGTVTPSWPRSLPSVAKTASATPAAEPKEKG